MSNSNIWTIDPSHSEIQFKAKHMVISTVTGQFNSFEGQLKIDGENFESGKPLFRLILAAYQPIMSSATNI